MKKTDIIKYFVRTSDRESEYDDRGKIFNTLSLFLVAFAVWNFE